MRQAALASEQVRPAATVSPILILTNQLDLGGAERYVVTISRWFAERGASVIVAASPGEFVDSLHPAVTYHPVELRDLRWSMPLAAWRIRQVIRRHRPRVIVANSLVTAWVATLAQAGLDLPVVVIGHGWSQRRFRQVSVPLRVADRVVPVSPLVERDLVRHGLPARKCRVIYNGIDLGPFASQSPERRAEARLALGAEPGDLVVATVGRYSSEKAQQHIVSVAGALRAAHPRLRFALIGVGPREAELRDLIAQGGLEDRVRLLISRHDVPDLLLAADVYVNCSDREGMPMSTIEAMAAGLPVVATATAGAPELITHEMGFIVPVGDAGAIGEAVARLDRDDDLRRRMGAAARARAEAHFSHDRMCSELARLLAEVVGDG